MATFKIIDKQSEQVFQEIERRIYRLQSGGTLDSLKAIGADTQGQIGASFVSLKQLASRYTPDETVALLLWNTGKREEQIIACLLLPEETNKEKITQLIKTCHNMEIAGYVGSLYLSHHPALLEISDEWLDSGIPSLQVAALTAIARHLIINKNNCLINKVEFKKILDREYKDNFVRMTAERYRFNL